MMEEHDTKLPSEQKLGETPVAPGNQATRKEKKAARPVKQALKKALADVDSVEKAEAVAAEIEAIAEDKTTTDVAQATPTPDSVTQAAQKVEQTLQTAPQGEKTGQTLVETARQVVAAEGRERIVISEAAQEVLNPEQQGKHDGREGQRDLLREAVLRRMAPYDALDARLFLTINHLTHTRFTNRFFYFLTSIFNGGAAWYALIGMMWMLRPRIGGTIVRTVTLPLTFATMLVEFPIKSYFRRKRPFISIVQAIVIGKKPGTWSFPSGHSASAFAGAWLLHKHFPRQGLLFYLIAAMVAFSRIFLGDHYPGDVVAGSLAGTVFAKLLSKLQDRLFYLDSK
jgi:undecaprenyl-diphosphatase